MLPISNSQNNVAPPTSYQKVQWYNGSKPFSMEGLLAQSSTQTMLLNTSPFRQLAIKAREKSVSSDSWNLKKNNMLSSAAFPTSSKPLGLPWLASAEPEQRNKESSTKPVDRKRLETHIKLDLDTLKGVKESVNRESASETNIQSEVKKLKPMKLQFFKTKMCPWVVSVGHCRKGASCRYAHSHEEIRPLPDLTKTKFCPRFTQGGQCKDGENCKYAHGYHELRATQSFSKTKLCPMWLINQCNVSGNMCRFAHGEQDLRPVSAGESDQDSCYITQKDHEFLLYSGPLPPSKCTEGCRGDSWSTARRLLSAETQTGCDNTVASIDTARTEFASPMDSSSQDGFTTRYWCSPHTTTTTTATTCGVSRQSPRTEPREMTVSESSPLIVPRQITTLEPTEKRESVTPVPHQMSSTNFNGAPELPCQPPRSNSSSLPHFLWATPSLGKVANDQKHFKDAASVTKDHKAKGPDMENGEAMSPCVTPVRVACRPAHSMDFTPTTQRPQTSTLRLPFSPLPLVWAALPSACEVSALQEVQFSPHTGSVQIPSPTPLAVDRLIATSPTKTPSAIVLHSGDASKEPTIVGACVAAPPLATSAQPPTSFSCATVSGATQVPLSFKPVSSPVPQMNYAPQNLALWNLYPVTSPLTHKEHASARCASPITQATWDGWELPSQIRSSIEQYPPFTKQCFATPTPTFPFLVDSQLEPRSQQVVPHNATSHNCEGVSRKAPIQGTPEPFEDATNGGRSAHSLRPLPQPMSPTTQSAKAEINQSNFLLYTSGLSPTPSWFVASTPQHSRHGKTVAPQSCFQFSELASSSFNEKAITASPITLQTGGVHSSSPHTTRYTVPPAANQPLNQLYLSPSIRLAASPLKFALPYASNYTLTEHNRSSVTVKYLQDSSSSLLPEFPFFPLRSQDDGNAPLRKKVSDGVDATTTTPAADRILYGSPLTMRSALSFTVQPNRLCPSLRPELEDAGNYCDFVPSPLLNASLATPADLPLGSSAFLPHNKVKYSTSSRLPNKEADEYGKRKLYASSARHHSSVDHCSASRLDSSEVRRTFSATPVPTPAPYWLSTDCSSNPRSSCCGQNGSYDETSGKRSFYESLPSQVDPIWGPTFASAQQPDGTCVDLSSTLYRPASQTKFESRNSVNLKQNSQCLSTANAIDAQPYHRSLMTSASLACGPRTASIMNTPQGYLSPQSSTYLPPQQNCIGESSPGNQCSASPSFFSTSSPWTSRSRYPPSPHTTTATIYSHPHTTYHPLA